MTTLKEHVIEAIAETLWEDDVRAGECADAILSAVSAHNRAMVEESAFVEAVARAIFEATGTYGPSWFKLQETTRVDYRKEAQAALDVVLRKLEETK